MVSALEDNAVLITYEKFNKKKVKYNFLAVTDIHTFS
jgi:hypothetical protein